MRSANGQAPILSAVVVAWNSADATAACLQSLRTSAKLAGVELEAIVVDNGSDDGSALMAAAAGECLIRNPVNAGFGVAASQGLALAQAPLALLVNPDVVVDEGFVGAVVAAAGECGGEVAALVPDVRFTEDPGRVNVRGIVVDEVGVPAEAESGELAVPLQGRRDVFGGSSGGCVFRLEALRRLGGLETAFFAYLEDVDLAWRLNECGYRAVLLPDAIAFHEGSASTGEGSWLKSFLVARNRRLLFRLHAPRSLRTRGWRVATEVGHAVWTIAAGAGTAPVVGRRDALRLRRYIRFVLASRRAAGEPIGSPVRLAPRVPFRQALIRKRGAKALMTPRRTPDSWGEHA